MMFILILAQAIGFAILIVGILFVIAYIVDYFINVLTTLRNIEKLLRETKQGGEKKK